MKENRDFIADTRRRHREQGLIRVEVLVPADCKERIKQLAAEMRDNAGSNPSRSPSPR